MRNSTQVLYCEVPDSQGEVVLPCPCIQIARCLEVSWAKQQRDGSGKDLKE